MINKQRVCEVLAAYAKQIEYPEKVTPRQFVQLHTNNFFKILLMKKLVKPEHYNEYRRAIIHAYKQWAINNETR